jgi:putative transposase
VSAEAPLVRATARTRGSQFTSTAFTGILIAAGARVSMDTRGRWMDNVFIERLWRNMKYEENYLKGYADGPDAKAGLSSWIAFLQCLASASGAG